jgi:selenocysteine lyase/cysteine desulfurase
MDHEELRAAMPTLADVSYMNTGASSPGVEPVVEATCEAERRFQYEAPMEEGMYAGAYDAFDETRAVVADFLGVGDEPTSVCLTNSTADGMSRIATAVPWERGDAVVTTTLEHPAGELPWERLAQTRDVEVRTVGHDGGVLDLDALADAAGDARLVCLSALDWGYGRRQDVRAAVETAHDAGARVLVDAVQSVGQGDVDVTEWGADFVAAASHKWLLGPWGAGFLYVDPGAAEWLSPERVSYRSVERGDEFEFAPGAKRLEVGTSSVAPFAGLRRAIRLVRDEIGYGTITSRIGRLTERLKEGLGDRLLSPRAYHSGLVTFEAAEPSETVAGLRESGVVVRDIPDPAAVRASIHVFNTESDVDRLLDALDEHDL